MSGICGFVFFECEAKFALPRGSRTRNSGATLLTWSCLLVLRCQCAHSLEESSWRQVESCVSYTAITLQFPFAVEQIVFLHHRTVAFCDPWFSGHASPAI